MHSIAVFCTGNVPPCALSFRSLPLIYSVTGKTLTVDLRGLLLVVVLVEVPMALQALHGTVIAEVGRHLAAEAHHTLQGGLPLWVYAAHGSSSWVSAPEAVRIHS